MRKHLLIAVCTLALLLSSPIVSDASPATKPTTADSPQSSGFFVDHYKNNISANTTAESNPVIGLLSEFNKLWTPGKTWNTGTKLNSRVLDANIQKSWILLNAARCLRKMLPILMIGGARATV